MAAFAVVGGGILLFVLLENRQDMQAATEPVSDVADDEQIVFFPSYAAFDSTNGVWQVHVHAWQFEAEATSTKRRAAVAAMAKLIGVPDDENSRKLFGDRIRSFLVDSESDKPIAVTFGGRSYAIGETDDAGHCTKVISVPAETFESLRKQFKKTSEWIPFRAALKADDTREFSGGILPVPETGLSIISDIDDTIKITEVTDRKQMIANSLYKPFRVVPDMSALYRDLVKRGAVFHYVSGSPWQFGESLQKLLAQEKFPQGTMHLRRFRLDGILAIRRLGDPSVKQVPIEALLKTFPKRRFLLFGDSGERDPEIYGAMARKYPKQIAGIFIRNVTAEKPDGKRMQTALGHFDKSRWLLFEKPAEARQLALQLLGD